jgi:hypothetical protein
MGKAMVTLLSLAVRISAMLGVRRVTSSALSATFNLLYWQGVCDELGSREALSRSLAAAHSRSAPRNAVFNHS